MIDKALDVLPAIYRKADDFAENNRLRVIDKDDYP